MPGHRFVQSVEKDLADIVQYDVPTRGAAQANA